jgi:transcriptional regulator of met regulon
MVKTVVNDELEWMRKEAAVIEFKIHPKICLENLKKAIQRRVLNDMHASCCSSSYCYAFLPRYAQQPL